MYYVKNKIQLLFFVHSGYPIALSFLRQRLAGPTFPAYILCYLFYSAVVGLFIHEPSELNYLTLFYYFIFLFMWKSFCPRNIFFFSLFTINLGILAAELQTYIYLGSLSDF